MVAGFRARILFETNGLTYFELLKPDFGCQQKLLIFKRCVIPELVSKKLIRNNLCTWPAYNATGPHPLSKWPDELDLYTKSY